MKNPVCINDVSMRTSILIGESLLRFFAQNDDKGQTAHHASHLPESLISTQAFIITPRNCVLAEISSSWTLITFLRVTIQMIQAGLSNMRLT